MNPIKRMLLPIGAGIGAMVVLMAVYVGIVSWAESPRHAIDLLWEERWIVIPIMLGFGVQSALYVIFKKRLFVPVTRTGPSGALTGAGGTTSTLAMAACCAHHVSDALPILGLAAAASFLAEYQTPFMITGLAINLIGIAVMLVILFRERRRAVRLAALDPASYLQRA